MIALDPGGRKFLVGYDRQGRVLTFGFRAANRLLRLSAFAGRIQSQVDMAAEPQDNRKRFWLRRAFRNLHERMKNLRRDAHCKILSFLYRHYDVVMLPRLNVAGK